MIPIWGFFAGFMLGAGATSFFDDSEFLSTVLGWILGFFIGLLFALIAYLFYEIAVVLAFAAIGFTFGSGLMTALNIDWDWFVILIGVAVGILFGIFAVVAELPMVVLVVFSTIAGALAMTAGLMLVFNALDTEDFSNAAIVDLIDDDWWWWVIAFALAIARSRGADEGDHPHALDRPPGVGQLVASRAAAGDRLTLRARLSSSCRAVRSPPR